MASPSWTWTASPLVYQCPPYLRLPWGGGGGGGESFIAGTCAKLSNKKNQANESKSQLTEDGFRDENGTVAVLPRLKSQEVRDPRFSETKHTAGTFLKEMLPLKNKCRPEGTAIDPAPPLSTPQ